MSKVELEYHSDVVVELVKHTGSDLEIVHAARVSTLGERFSETNHMEPEELERFIGFLMRERHGSPFEHSYFTFFIRVPLFVMREHMRHRIASYNEESARYRVISPYFYIPDKDRKLVQVGKPGAYTFEQGTEEQYVVTLGNYKKSCEDSYERYQEMLSQGIAREVARGVLPQTIYTSAYVTINSRSLMNFLSLRRNVEGQTYPSYPQREIEMVAEKYEEFFKTIMPQTHSAFVKYGRVAP